MERAIELLDYKPSTVARSLYNKKSRLIGLVVPNIVNPFFPEIARAVEDVAHKQGYTVVLCNSDESLEKEKQYIDVLRQNNVDGFIVATNPENSVNYMNISVPVVAIDRLFNERIPTVYADNYAGIQKATKLLLEKGCNHIAHIRGPRDVSTANERFEGFVDMITEYGLSYMIAESTFDPANSERVARKLLDEYPHIDGIVAGNDLIAIGVVKVALQKGIAIPNDLQIIGFDGISLAEMMCPSITTVAQPIYEMGRIATELLLEQMEGKRLETEHYRLPIEIIERNTTK